MPLLDRAGPHPGNRDKALLSEITKGTALSSVRAAVRAISGGDGWESKVKDLYERAVQKSLARAMVGESGRDLTLVLQAIQTADIPLAREIALALSPSLEACLERSDTPWQVENAATAFLEKFGY